MPEYDLLVRGASPLPEIGIANGAIAGFTAASAREEIDATGLSGTGTLTYRVCEASRAVCTQTITLTY